MPPTQAQLALTLYYPTRAAATTTITLRAPEFGNRETPDLRQVVEETAAGALIAYTRGATTYRLDLDFQFVSRTQRDALESFFLSTVEGAISTFEMRVPKYWSKDANGIPIQAYLYAGCEFDMGGAIEFGEERDGWYSTSLSIRSTGRTSVA